MKLFVYGTLKSSMGAARLMHEAGCKLIGPHTTNPEFKFYDFGGFPGAKLGGSIPIQGELWDATNVDWKILNRYEGYYPDDPESSMFVKMYHFDGREKYFMYLFNGDPGTRLLNESGVWPR